MEFIKPERIWIREHPELSEKWVQDRIAEEPSILGLGDLIPKDKEKIQPKAGRLDLLLQDPETDRRYEVEIQLGKTDESHIIRTIEYWDIERKRYPQYDHCCVIVAEDVTSRFLNVISLFNSTIPLIAIQMRALGVGGKVALVFTTVLDELTRGLDEEDDGPQEATNRPYWEGRSSKEMLAITDEMLAILKQSDPRLELNYHKYYIGLARNGESDNFVIFKPTRNFVRIEAKVEQSEELRKRLEEAGIDMMPYDKRWGAYRIRLTKPELPKHQALISEILKRAYADRG